MNPTYNELIGEINALKSLLRDTDYKALKYSEGIITDEEYAETRASRQSWRERINEIEEMLETMAENEISEAEA